MARNYCDIPILVVKLKVDSSADITTAQFLKSGGGGAVGGGWLDASAAGTTCGFYSLGPGTAYDSAVTYGNKGWVRALALGTVWGSPTDSIQAGMGVIWSETAARVDSCADSCYRAFGTLIDGAAAAATRGNRIFISGYGTPNAKWDTIA